MEFLSFSVTNKSDKFKRLVNAKNNCGSLTDKCHTNFNDICSTATKKSKANFQNNTTWSHKNNNSNINF